MDKIIKFYKEQLPIFVLISNTIGYTFITIYYSKFGIDIEYYLSFSDLLFFSLDLLLTLGIVLGIVELALLMITSLFISSDEKDDKDNKKSLERERNFQWISFFLMLGVGFLIMFIFGYELYVFTIMMTLMIIKLHSILNISDKINDTEEEETKSFFNRFMLIFLSIILIGLSFIYGWREADKVKAKDGFLIYKEVEFNFKDKFYSTADSTQLTFVGETSDNLFLYDTTENKSLIFYKNRLNNVIKIHDPTILTNEQEEEIKELENKIHNFLRDTTKENKK